MNRSRFCFYISRIYWRLLTAESRRRKKSEKWNPNDATLSGRWWLIETFIIFWRHWKKSRAFVKKKILFKQGKVDLRSWSLMARICDWYLHNIIESSILSGVRVKENCKKLCNLPTNSHISQLSLKNRVQNCHFAKECGGTRTCVLTYT